MLHKFQQIVNSVLDKVCLCEVRIQGKEQDRLPVPNQQNYKKKHTELISAHKY